MGIDPQGDSYARLLELTKEDASPAEIESFMVGFWQSPLFHQLQLFSNQAVRILDAGSFEYLYVSPSMREITGYEVDEIKHGGLRFMYRCVPLADIVRLTLATIKVKRALKKMTPEEKMQARFSFDLRFTCKDGREKKILQNCHILKLNELEEPLILLFASTDITEYKRDSRMNYSLSVFSAQRGFVDVIRESILDEPCPLSARELEILRLTSLGQPEREIANTLHLSIETVKTHRKNMLQKSKAKNAVELVRMAIAKSWI